MTQKFLKILLLFVMVCGKSMQSPFLFSTGSWALKKLFGPPKPFDMSTGRVDDLVESSATLEKRRAAKASLEKEEDPFGSFSLDEEESDDIPKKMTKDDDYTTEEMIGGGTGILHKKAWKLLKKLQLFSALRSDWNLFKNINQSGESGLQQDGEYLPPPNGTESSKQVASSTAQRTTQQANKSQKLVTLENGNFGVFLMEFFASIATLFTSAAYQLQHLALTSAYVNNTLP